MTIQDAARLMGISEGAVRKRVDRGTLESEKGDDGRVYVLLPVRRDNGVDAGVYGRVDGEPRVEVQAYEALVEDLRGQVEYLRDELRHEREEHAEESRRKDHLLAALMQRVRELEAASDEPLDGRESAAMDAVGYEAPDARRDAQTEARCPAEHTQDERRTGGSASSAVRRKAMEDIVRAK